MSGRSAYVRKKKGDTHQKDAALQFQLQQAAARQHFLEQNEGSLLARSDSSRQNPVNYPTRSGASFSSGSSDNGRHTLPSLQAVNPSVSAIEKSSLRAYMDSKSDQIRNKLASKFSAKPESAASSGTRPETRAAMSRGRADQFVHELPSTPVAIPHTANPTLASRPRVVRANDGLGLGFDGRTRSGEEARVKRWLGGGKPPQPWNKLRKDPELWDSTGDTLVFFGHETHQTSRPPPSFRISSSILEETESAFLITILREGYTYNEYNLPPSPESAPSTDLNSGESSQDIQSRSGNGSGVGSPNQLTTFRRHMNDPSSERSYSRMKTKHPTPPLSETTSNEREYPILHEIYFPAPLNQSRTDTLRHHLTTRNFFSLLMHKSLVGLNFCQALLDLYERLEMYMPPDSDNAGLMIDYITAKSFDDVRNDPSSAIGLLIWSEGEGVRWQEGWREAFVNCAGMYNRLHTVHEYRQITPITRALLDRANLELQVRVQQAEARLANFDLTDMWPMASATPPPSRAAFDRFRKFLVKFYETVYWAWPPQGAGDRPDNSWLTRDLTVRLQRDFGALYDFLVDRDLVWDESEERSSRKWNIVSKRLNPNFRADSEDLPITDVFVAFDNRHRYPHIPHPFPLVPDSQPVTHTKPQLFFGSSKKSKTSEDRAKERLAALAYSEATNIYLLGSEFVSNDLVEAFTRFEKSDRPNETNPYDARKGRWILLYGILQVLATVSVDTPSLRWKDEVPYFLNPRLRGTPPWRTHSDPPVSEAAHNLSYCWTVPESWSPQRHHLIIKTSTAHVGAGESISARTSDDTGLGRIRYANPSVAVNRITTITNTTTDANNGDAYSPVDEDDDARTDVVIGQRAKDWVNSGGEYGGGKDNVTLPVGSQREKTRDWPMPPREEGGSRGLRGEYIASGGDGTYRL
ncbi:hypothetical protein FGG08_006639 [Glutinoglossum americanum]|uniref:DUF8004 domain-containing protein n=1 Tax=Glutinoglossum americanum TaxID=1670608 RepID=A0A9P8KUR9_9PEZI|nr:hypothetical protein FGG08_006639 [Glutinoglossum americanum]